MKLLVDVSMIALLAILGVDVLFLAYAAAQGDGDGVLDFLEMTQGELAAPMWFSALILATSFFTWICIAMVFWPLHQIIRLKVFSFSDIGLKLKQSAFAGIGFWGGSTLLFSLFPLIMVWCWPTGVCVRERVCSLRL